MEELDVLIYYKKQAAEFLLDFAPKFVIAAFVVIVGFAIVKLIMKMVQRIFSARHVEKQVASFLGSLIDGALKIGVILLASTVLGFQTASIMAMLAAIGFAVGMALQGNLANFASGIMVMLFKPYKVDDFVEIAGETGRVTSIEIFNTKMETADGKEVIVPNGIATSDKIINHSTDGSIRVDCFFHIPYESSFDKVEAALLGALDEHALVLKDPAPAVAIQAYDSHNIQIGVFSYCEPKDYWTVFYAINRSIKRTLGQLQVPVAYSEGVELGTIEAN